MSDGGIDEFESAGDEVYRALLARAGEGNPAPRLEPTRKVLELLGDPQRAYPIIQLTGTNGKTSTSRMIESILRAYGLRTGLFTSPHLQRFNERIALDGAPIGNEALAANWADIEPYVAMVDAELGVKGEPLLTYFEVLSVLAFASFADAPVDVAVIEVGMGGEWDSTNVADAQVAVFTPIDLDHTSILGHSIAEIARTKAGIIKPAATVVTAEQSPEAMREIERAAELTEAKVLLLGRDFSLADDVVAVGGQQVSITGVAGEYNEIYLPLYGDHQGKNAAVAVAAVEAFFGEGTHTLSADLLSEGLAEVTSPGRLQLIGTEPTTLVDAAHNPHGARSLAESLDTYFDFDEIALVVGVLADKDASGILSVLAPLAQRLYLTQPQSDRSVLVDDLAERSSRIVDPAITTTHDDLEDALESAREWGADSDRRLVVVAGSVLLAGEAITLAEQRGWKK
ncbi:folylpolyglutamate synthase/dihydrofolate synthase family protein [Okibacterium endophyticum]